jgi:hypothetical protein
MSDPRTMDCELWATREAKRLRKTKSAQILSIKPKPGYLVLGGIRLPPNDELFWPSPPWHHHFAVISEGLVRDEIYPNGLPLADYKAKFEYESAIDFVVTDR